MSKITIGISECLLGNNVRYNGGHKHSRICTQELGDYFEFVPACPEVAIGLGVPRKPIRLVNIDGETRVRDTDTHTQDYTDALYHQGESYMEQNPDIYGFVFTQNSPSCGLHGVKVYHQNGNPLDKDQGLFASAIVKKAPYLPVEESGRLNDATLRETFVTAVYCYHDWCTTVEKRNDKKSLVDFHARHKLLLMSHSNETYKHLGRLVGNLKNGDFAEVKSAYLNQFMQAIRTPATRGQHCNTLMHIQGYLKKALSSGEKSSLSRSILDYQKGYVPLIVPVTLLNHYTHLVYSDADYINQQSYLKPHPMELGLRNEI